MKSFFKKIGKGLKKLGKGIMKVLNSKIGRIIGMVSLAFGVGTIFKAMYQGLTQGTAQTAAAAGASSGTGIVVEEGVSTAAQKAAKAAAEQSAQQSAQQIGGEVAKETVQKTTQEVGRELTTNGNIAISNVGEAASKVGALAENATATATSSVSSAADAGFKSSLNNTTTQFARESEVLTKRAITPKEVLTQTPASVETVVATAPVESTSLLGDPNVMEAALQGDSARALTPEVTTQSILANPTTAQTATAPLDVAASPSVEEFLRESEVLTKGSGPTLEARVSEFQIPSKKLADALKNPTTRARYDELVPLTEGLKTEAGRSLQLTPSAQLEGVQEFTSFKEAFQGGDNLLSSAGNVAERAMTYDLGELTKGKLTGFVGRKGVYNTATVTAGMLAGTQEVDAPAGRNPYSAAISADLAAQGATTAYQPQTLAMDFSNQIATGNVANPFTTLNNIRQKAGFSNIYGSLNSMAGVVG
tara:strand:+ start:2839 stop:4266 length:1428 start_codon:yes stop_codon:yes gene_type:complete